MSGRVVVVGAINTDLVVNVPRLPAPGDTVLGTGLARHPGGKGANQAVAAARVGASVSLVACIGRDEDGARGLQLLQTDGVDVAGVLRVDAPSGLALIVVDPGGANQIAVAPGANALLDPPTVSDTLEGMAPGPEDVVLASLEVPLPAVGAAARAAARRGARLVLNPAPAAALPRAVMAAHPILTPNRAELARLAGIDELEPAANALLAAGAAAVIATLGQEGCVLFEGAEGLPIAGTHGPVVDTTGAGDCFNGVLAAELASGMGLAHAARVANLAAGLSVRAAGARGGIPRRAELEAAVRA